MLGSTVLQKVLALTGAGSAAPEPGAGTLSRNDIRQLFGPSLSAGASILMPSDQNYTELVTQRWTIHEAPSFLATIQPATVEDVENIVRIATSHKIDFLATGGGHGMSSNLRQVRHGVQVDMAKFVSVELQLDDAQEQQPGTLIVGGGAKFSHIIDRLAGSDSQFPLGTANCVGVVGATLGGGVSSGQGVMGLLSDIVESVQVVTAAGKAVTASRDVNPDLFWALRGAGASFGIVTRATYRLPQTVNNGNVVNANFLYPLKMVESVFGVIAELDDALPAELAFNTAVFYNPAIDQVVQYPKPVPPSDAKIVGTQMVVIVNANYYGPLHEAERHLKPLVDLGPLQREALLVSWPHVFETSYFGIDDKKACSRGQHVNMYSISATQTDVKAVADFADDLLAFSRSHPSVASTFVIHRFPQDAVLRVPDDSSAYSFRNNRMHIQLESSYDDFSLDGEVDQFLQQARTRFVQGSGYSNASVYVNFAHGDEGPEAWYGLRKLQRLEELKNKWDPRRTFNFFNPIDMAL